MEINLGKKFTVKNNSFVALCCHTQLIQSHASLQKHSNCSWITDGHAAEGHNVADSLFSHYPVIQHTSSANLISLVQQFVPNKLCGLSVHNKYHYSISMTWYDIHCCINREKHVFFLDLQNKPDFDLPCKFGVVMGAA